MATTGRPAASAPAGRASSTRRTTPKATGWRSGIARTLDMSLTGTGEVAGTPSYMAPEVFTGQRAGPAADVFAWGAVMVLAATGQDPFAADNLGGVMHRVLSDRPDLAGLPSRPASLVSAAMEKDPAARPAARDLLLALVSGNGTDTGGLLAAGSRAALGVRAAAQGDPALGTIAAARAVWAGQPAQLPQELRPPLASTWPLGSRVQPQNFTHFQLPST
ncbi:MAG TPA: hypothetical protein VM347_01870 [Nonomuraea sp.]|nr:hypothetical protein [Nonomuraea sp.]